MQVLKECQQKQQLLSLSSNENKISQRKISKKKKPEGLIWPMVALAVRAEAPELNIISR